MKPAPFSSPRHLAPLLGLALVLGACPEDSPEADTTSDTGADTTSDTASDTGADTASDTGADTAESGCRTDDDCDDTRGEHCMPRLAVTAYHPVCGIPCEEEHTCDKDGDCAGETPLCLTYLGTCCRIGEPSSTTCGATCTDDGACGEGQRCRADGRGCEPVPCDEGFGCPAMTDCRPEAATDVVCQVPWLCAPRELEHGCVRRTCTADANCGGGLCVAGACHDSLGLCQGAVP